MINFSQAWQEMPWGGLAYDINFSGRSGFIVLETSFTKKGPQAGKRIFELDETVQVRSVWGTACYSRPGGRDGLAAIVASIHAGGERLLVVNLLGPNRYHPMIVPVRVELPQPLEFSTLEFNFFDDLDKPTNFRWALTLWG